MDRRVCIASGVMLGVLFFVSVACAQPGRAQQFKHADRNKDGMIDRKEWKMEKKWENKQQERSQERAKESWEHKQRSRVNNWWEKRADTNNDGVVDSNELSAWKKLEKERIDLNNDGVIDAKEKRLCWRHARSKVNTALEQKYDTNSDGWLEPNEAKELLQDKHTLIKTHGKAKVDTEIESEYDANKDGIIDAEEAKSLKEDLE